MICQRCLRAASRRSGIGAPSWSGQVRTYAAPTSSNPPSVPQSAAASSSHQPPAATSTSAAQPHSSPLTPRARTFNPRPSTPAIKSSVPAGTILKNLNVLRGGRDPIALPDEEYPPWLWTLLADTAADAKSKKAAEGEGDLYAKSAKQRRKAGKALRKKEAAMVGREAFRVVPVEEQSVDLTVGGAKKKKGKRGAAAAAAGSGVVLSLEDNVQAAAARAEITKALRRKRRSSIKETNFLKSMS